nr:class I SAM-dependent methyltransferase [Rhodococcus sp. HNM0569]
MVVPESAHTVADVGAGTGKLTAVLRRLGHDVTAIDPDRRMLDALGDSAPEVRTLVGAGESLPLPDSSVDAVTYGQAWHWVDAATASCEAARVLRPGGVLVLIWNIRDPGDSFARALDDAIGSSPAETLIDTGGPEVRAPFAGFTHRTHSWTRTMSPAGLDAMVRSRSPYLAADDAQRLRVLAAVADLTGGREVRLPYVTHAYVAAVPG